MTAAPTFVAELLSTTGPGLARLAAERTVDRLPDVARYGEDPVALWREHLLGRLADLSLALASARPDQFADQVGWARVTFSSRGLPDEDLRTSVECLAGVLADELPPDARGPAAACLDATLARWAELGRPEPSALEGGDEATRLAAQYVVALLEGDRRRACDPVLEAVRDGRLDVRDAILHICLPAEKELGRMWHSDEITIAEEHFISATTERLLAQLVALGQPAPASGRTVVAAALAGDEHDIGLRAVSDLFELDGWRVVFLGSDLPIDELVWAAETLGADLVVLSATQFGHAPAVREAIARLEAVCQAAGKARPRVLVGGGAFAGVPDLWRETGADAVALDAGEAVGTGRRLVGLDAAPSGR